MYFDFKERESKILELDIHFSLGCLHHEKISSFYLCAFAIDECYRS